LDQRYEQLVDWLDRRIRSGSYAIAPASADASFRRYFRVSGEHEPLIVMDAPPEKEDTRPFIRIAQKFRSVGLNVPEIIEADVGQGFLLLSDLGSRTYLRHLNPETVERLYGDAMGALIVLQAGTYTEPDFLPGYSRQLLLDEMELFRQWLLVRHLKMDLTDEQQRLLDDSFERLAALALEQPAVWVHRDYHSRNLMLTDRDNPGILDFQDGVSGPITYDLVSLLKDCYIAWPREQVVSWVKGYYQLALDSGLNPGDDDEQFLRWFDFMGIQRHLKASGIFARLWHRDGKPGYLGDIPRTLGYISSLKGVYPEFDPLIDLVISLDHTRMGIAESPK